MPVSLGVSVADSEWVQMRHEGAHGKNGVTATAKREAFNTVWKKKGWSLVGENGAVDGPVAVPGADEVVEQVTEAEVADDAKKGAK